MSIFSKLKQSKKAAKEHKVKSSKQIQAEDLPKIPYKHVPTHAAVDALSGAPSSWQHEDRPRILEQHKRRSMMTITRTGSSLSTRTHGSTAPAVPSLLRHGSYNAYNPSWNDRGDYSYLSEPYQKRNRISRNHSFIDSGIGPSPLASKAPSNRASPSSSSNSSLTDDNLEIAPSKSRPQVTKFNSSDAFASLHKSTLRKVGEVPANFSRPTSAAISPPAPATPIAPVAPVTHPADGKQKRRWLMKGKGREVAVAS